MDIIDDAKAREEQARAWALANQQAQSKEPNQYVTAGGVLCIDCANPINKERLAAKPNAARCIECQGFFEYSAGAHHG